MAPHVKSRPIESLHITKDIASDLFLQTPPTGLAKAQFSTLNGPYVVVMACKF